MTTVPQICAALERVLWVEADAVAHSTGFTQRESKLTAPLFMQTLVFGWMADPNASVETLTKMAASRGVSITSQGLENRFTLEAVFVAAHLLTCAIEQALSATPAQAKILRRFTHVLWQDSTIVMLPEAWATWFPSCGGSEGAPASGVKLQVQLDALTGLMQGPVLQPARSGDLPLLAPHVEVEAGSLRLHDRGYWDVGMFATWDAQQVFFISYLKTGTALFDATGAPLDLLGLLSCTHERFDLRVQLSAKHMLACRLIGVRLSEQVAQIRRERLAEYERKQGVKASALQLLMTQWSVVVTNAPSDQLTIKEALVVIRSRWQIEILFKVWKSHLGVGTSRSAKPARVMCELLVKVLIAIIDHWIMLTSVWSLADRSIIKAAIGLRLYAGALALAFDDRRRFMCTLVQITAALLHGSRVTKRGANPSTAQLLLSFDASS